MLKQMTYKEMSNLSNQITSELHWLREDSKQFDLLHERFTYLSCRVTGSSIGDDPEDPRALLSLSPLTRNSILLDLIKAIDYRVNFLVSCDSHHGLDIIEDIAKCLPEGSYNHSYGSILISNYFKGDYFND